jgi:hypothetical protein
MSAQITKRELLSKHALSARLGVGALALMLQRASADTLTRKASRYERF